MWAGIFLFLFLAAAVLLLCEFSARFYLQAILQKSFSPKYEFNSYRVVAHKPGFKEGPSGQEWIVINPQGFRRVPEVEKTKPEGVFRVFLLGGSAAHGISSTAPYPVRHIYPDQTIDACLEKMLLDKYPDKKIEVINAAVSGYQVFQHTLYLVSELMQYSPDLVIFFDGYNDHFVSNPDYDQYANYHYQFWKDKLKAPSFGSFLYYGIFWLSKYSVIARGYCAMRLQKDAFAWKRRNQARKTWPTSGETLSKHREAASKLFLQSIKNNLLLLRGCGIDSILCFQPMLALRDLQMLSESERTWRQTFLKGHDTVAGTFYPVIIEEVQNVADQFQVPFVDMVKVFNQEIFHGRQLFIDYAHLSPEGSQTAASALLPLAEQCFHSRQRSPHSKLAPSQ